jgi:DNA-directed RNA polymerase subunit RPC12/RpoP
LRASLELLGLECPCPRCGYRVVVKVWAPSDADINLVGDEK